jgi:hypothetical protein
MLKTTNILRKNIQMMFNLMKISYSLNHFCALCERFDNFHITNEAIWNANHINV